MRDSEILESFLKKSFIEYFFAASYANTIAIRLILHTPRGVITTMMNMNDVERTIYTIMRVKSSLRFNGHVSLSVSKIHDPDRL
jgi:hypothetical protein